MDEASQIDISLLSIQELHKLQDRIVRRMAYLRELRDQQHVLPEEVPTKEPSEDRSRAVPGGRRGFPQESQRTLEQHHAQRTLHDTAATAGCPHVNMADTVIGTHAVTDPWSFSPCPPQRYEYAFWQGRPLPMQNVPPARALWLDAANGTPPAFGGVPHQCPLAESQALVLRPQFCERRCAKCPSRCGKLPVEHHHPELHLCSRCDLPLLQDG